MVLYQLSDGQVVTIRPIRPDDRMRLQASHARLSAQSRYRRFMAAKPNLSVADARYLADVDGRDHVALVATVAGLVGEVIVAVGRFIRVPDEATVAEFAIVVGDDWQHQGLGTELLARLGQAARARGISRFRASMLAENGPIHRLIEGYAAGEVIRRRTGSTCEVEFPLPPAVPPGPAALPAAQAA